MECKVPIDPDTLIMIEEMEEKGLSIKENLSLLLPEYVKLTYLAKICKMSRNATYAYLVNNFMPGRDYVQPKKNGSIYIARAAVIKIKDFYESKKNRKN